MLPVSGHLGSKKLMVKPTSNKVGFVIFNGVLKGFRVGYGTEGLSADKGDKMFQLCIKMFPGFFSRKEKIRG